MPDRIEGWVLKTYIRAWRSAVPIALLTGLVFGTVSMLLGEGWRSAVASLVLWPAILMAAMTFYATIAVMIVSVYRLFERR